ncbi:MAG: hypothetical protein WD847_04745 [Pirellulales bacterium]
MIQAVPAWNFEGRLKAIRQMLELAASLRLIGDLTTSDGLRRAISAMLEFAELLGIDAQRVQWLRGVLLDEGVLNILAALVQYAWGRTTQTPAQADQPPLDSSDGSAELQGIEDWLPLILEILKLIRQLRGGR